MYKTNTKATANAYAMYKTKAKAKAKANTMYKTKANTKAKATAMYTTKTKAIAKAKAMYKTKAKAKAKAKAMYKIYKNKKIKLYIYTSLKRLLSTDFENITTRAGMNIPGEKTIPHQDRCQYSHIRHQDKADFGKK